MLFCQRASLVWDARLHQTCADLYAVAAWGVFLLGIIEADFIRHDTVLDYIGSLILPSLPALLESGDIRRRHYETAAFRERLARDIDNLATADKGAMSVISDEQCRHIQDCLYLTRSQRPLVPNWLYVRRRERYTIDMQETVDAFRVSVGLSSGGR